jgi:hypothetical protein
MSPNPFIPSALLAVILPFVPIVALAQAPAPRPVVEQSAPAQPAAQALEPVREDRDAETTRQALMEMLEKYPPSLARVLRLDPTLLRNEDYLATYPELAQFLAQHPQVGHNPEFYLEHVRGLNHREPTDARSQAIGVWRNMIETTGIVLTIALFVGAFIWLVRTLVDYRRWSRLSKVQTDVHTKILDRFSSNDDLLAYIRTPAGSRFLESAPIALDGGGPVPAPPVNRILWSVQAGIVLGALGIGILFMAGRAPEEVAQGVSAAGVLAIALGVGFIVAAGVSYVLSQKLGLLEPTRLPATEGRESR